MWEWVYRSIFSWPRLYLEVSGPCSFTLKERASGTHWIGGWVGRGENSWPYRDSNSDPSVVQSPYQLHCPDSTSVMSIQHLEVFPNMVYKVIIVQKFSTITSAMWHHLFGRYVPTFRKKNYRLHFNIQQMSTLTKEIAATSERLAQIFNKQYVITSKKAFMLKINSSTT
jgi:ribosomal protein S16